MRFEWDENKRSINLKNHGIDFADVWQMFENETHTIIDDRFDYEVTRFFTLGLINGRVFAVAHTENDEIIRIISARKVDKDDEAKYFKKIRN